MKKKMSLDLKKYLPEGFVKSGNRYFLNGNSKLVYSGLFLGEDKNGVFFPSLSFVEMISDEFNEVVLNQKNAWLFTCGKKIVDVVKDADDGIVIVKNGYNEILGIAEKDGKFVNPIWDVGYLLRREISK